MSDGSKPQLGLKGGHAGTYPAVESFSLLAAPTTAKDVNTVRLPLIPVACWRLNDLRFEFDSSFVLPEAEGELKELDVLRKAHPGAPLSIFGHADPVSDDAYNKALSGRRAEAIYALLIRDAARWEKLYSAPGGGDNWGLKSTQIILKTLGFDLGEPTGKMNPQTKAAVEKFQGENDLKVDGDPGKKTREKLYPKYMDLICPPKLEKSDFLGKGADTGGKADFQGCSEFNPVMLFSKKESAEFSKPEMRTERNEENSPNRRVMVLLFRKGSVVQTGRWPCPRASEGVTDCKKRFWSDGEKRRSNQEARREFDKTKDTFACRFYHRLTISSPCEGIGPITPTLLLLKLLKVDDHFCPKTEMLDIEYALKNLSGKSVKLQISSAHSTKNPIFERELTPDEKTDGNHQFQWDGKASVADGDLKDRFVHPLLSPFTVTLFHTDIHKDSLEFKVLYHSIALKNGPWTPDEKEPPESDDKAWVAFKLNELGFYGGPVGKDTDDYLKKAIIRYKANHKKFKKMFAPDYNDTIDADLKAALKAKENDRKFPVPAATEDSSKKSDVSVECITYERITATTREFGQTRPQFEKLRINRPLIPVEAEVYLKKKDDSKVLEPEAVGPVRISWRFKEADEDLSTQFADTAAEPSKTKKYIEKALKQKGGRAGKGDNCPKDFAGIREDEATDWKAPFLVGDSYIPFKIEEDAGSKVVFSKASIDKDKFPKRLGRAGVFFRPSYIAADDYQFSAEIDFAGLTNKTDLEKFHAITDEKSKIKAETGIYTVRRFNRVAMSIDWPARTNSYEWDKIETEYKKSFLDVDVGGIVTKKMTQVLTTAEYKAIVTSKTTHTDASKITFHDNAMVGVALPVQGNLDADDYKTAVKTYTHKNFNSKIQRPLGDKLSEVVRKDHATGFIVVNFLLHKPINVKNDPANGDNAVTAANTNFITWGGSIGLADSVILADQKDPDKVYYVIAHEMGHNFYLLHWENTGETNTTHHDTDDHNCLMSYSTNSGPAHQKLGIYTPHLCGRCNLSVRGWDVTNGTMPAKSTKVGATTEKAPKLTLKLKWSKPKGRCGDKPKLLGQTTLPDGTAVTIKLKPTKGSAGLLADVNVVVAGGKFEQEWEVKNIGFEAPGGGFIAKEVIEATAEADGVDPAKAKLEVEALLDAPEKEFKATRAWSGFTMKPRFRQKIQGFKCKVTASFDVLKAWGGYFVDLTSAGITGKKGGCPWEGYRWGRAAADPMTPDEYYDGTAWVPFPVGFALTGTNHSAIAFYKSGSKFKSTSGGTWPEAFADYNFDSAVYKAKRKAWIDDTHDRWSDEFHVRRKNCASQIGTRCCRYDVDVTLSFKKVTAHGAGVVALCPGTLRSNASIWFMDEPRVQAAAHESGHHLDNPDEYAGGAVDPTLNGDGAVNGIDADCIMGQNLTDVKKRHYHAMAEMVKKLVKAKYGTEYDYEVVAK